MKTYNYLISCKILVLCQIVLVKKTNKFSSNSSDFYWIYFKIIRIQLIYSRRKLENLKKLEENLVLKSLYINILKYIKTKEELEYKYFNILVFSCRKSKGCLVIFVERKDFV